MEINEKMKDKKDIILYVDDQADLFPFERRMARHFPNHSYQVEFAYNSFCLDRMLNEGELNLENIALVLMDGNFGTNVPEGWEIAQGLRERGYINPILYISDSPLPEGKAELFDEIRLGKIPIEAMRKYLDHLE